MLKHAIVTLAIASLTAIGPGNLFAQASADSTSMKQGAWAFQFGVAGNFTLTSFQGSTLALKYHCSDNRAIRAAITVNGNFTDGTDLQTGVLNDTGHSTASNDNVAHSSSVALAVQYLWYVNPADVVHFYAGFGPSVSYSRSHSEAIQGSLESQDTYYYAQGYDWTQVNASSTSSQWGFGVRGVAGVEWFAVRWFSLRAEYGQSIQYQWTSTTATAQGVASYPISGNASLQDKASSKGWVISPLGVSFGASVYF